MTNLFLSFFTISVSTGCMVLVLLLLSPFLNKRYAAKWKCFIWIFLAVRLLVPLGGGSGQLIIDRLLQTRMQTAAEAGDSAGGLSDALYRPIMVEIPEQMTTPIVQDAAQSGEDNTGITALDIVAFVWLTGVLLLVTIHLISYFRYKRQVMRKGKLIEDDIRIFGQMFALKCDLQIRRTVRVIEYREAESPMMMGFVRPVLVLPREQYSSEELFFILKHELVHLRRGDVYLKLLWMTANAVHWFNPLIWMMQKEAVIDIELSCDERVTQDADYAGRKAYTETLLSTLHKRCGRKTVLSTQFYGGTKIMKKRFVNILKNGRRNGFSVLVCAVILTFSFGALVGCSVTKKDTDENAENLSEQLNQTDLQGETAQAEVPQEDAENPQTSADVLSDDQALDHTTTLTFYKEGEEELKQAVLAVGDGYSLYLPDGEWQQSDADLWTATVNDQVWLWVTRYENASVEAVNQELSDDGYTIEEEDDWQKTENDLITHVRLKEAGNDIWGIFYRYPIEAEEGWGRELPVLADTFAVSDN